MKEILEKMIIGLRKQVVEKVPKEGPFPVVYEREDVSDMKIGLSHLIFKVTSVDSKDSKDKRLLELGAVNYPSPYGAECVIGYGSTQDIMNRLQDDGLKDELLKKVSRLIEDIDYEERHPWG